MFFSFGDMTDCSAAAEAAPGSRVRVTYGPNIAFSLDLGEAVDLVTELAGVLAHFDHETELRRNEDEIIRAATIREALQ